MCARRSDAIARGATRARSIVLMLALTLAACAHAPADPRERLAQYRQQAGAPMAGFDYVRHLRWEALGDQALAVWPRRDTGFLLEFASPCPGLDRATAIRLSHADGRVRARLDGVRVLSLPGSPPVQRAACPILLVRPIQAANAPPADLRDIDSGDDA